MSSACRTLGRYLCRWVVSPGLVAGLVLPGALAAPGTASAHSGPAHLVASTASTVAAPTTTTTLAPAVLQWKDKYLSVVGALADDALVADDTGKQGAKHPTRKKVQATLSACLMWQSDAKTALSQAPPIPSATMERWWRKLVSASRAASSACVNTLTKGSKASVTVYHKQLLLVDEYESRLVGELGASHG